MNNMFNALNSCLIVLVFAFMVSCMDQVDVKPEPQGDALTHSSTIENDANSAIKMKSTFTAHLIGGQEVPPVATAGTGQAIFKLSKDGTSLSYKLIVTNTINITQAHIHCGETGVNGPVVAFLFGLVPEGVTKNGILAEGTITAANVIARPDSEACMGGVAGFEQLVEKIANGSAYVNVHTVAHPAGEIRGQIK